MKNSKEKNKEYVDLFDLPFYGGMEEMSPYFSQLKKIEEQRIFKEILDKTSDRS